jgi:4-amino-4-deoxy-L-arabinose transferase-like glycosyltransferase
MSAILLGQVYFFQHSARRAVLDSARMKRVVRIIEASNRRRIFLALMVLTCFTLRLAIIFHFETYRGLQGAAVLNDTFTPKHDGFAFGYETGSIARSIATGKGFSSPFGDDSGPTAWIAPVYPYLCALIFKLFGVFTQTSGIVILALNSFFEALACIYIVRIGEKTVGRTAGWSAGWVWAACFLFTRWATTWVWDMALSALLLTMVVDQTLDLAEQHERKPWLMYGFTWGLIALTNPSMLATLPVCAVWLISHGLSWRFVRNGVLASAVFFALITPWLVRNRVVFGTWVFIRSNAGFEFSLGNYPSSTGLGWIGRHPSQNKSEMAAYKQQGELRYIAERKARAVKWVRQDPQAFLRLSAKRCFDWWYGTRLELDPADVWRPWMYYSLSIGAIGGLWLAIRRRVRGGILLAGVVALFPVVYYVIFTHPRYRHGVEPVMLVATMYLVMAPLEALRSIRARRHDAAAVITQDMAIDEVSLGSVLR